MRTLERKISKMYPVGGERPVELYAFEEDAGERRDLANDEAVQASDLLEAVIAWTATHAKPLWGP